MAAISDILAKLIDRTKQDKVQWQPTASEQTFVAVIGNNSVMISSPRGLLVPDVILRILDKNGRELGRLDSTSEGGNRTAELRQLYETARSVALSAPNVLEELLEELERI